MPDHQREPGSRSERKVADAHARRARPFADDKLVGGLRLLLELHRQLPGERRALPNRHPTLGRHERDERSLSEDREQHDHEYKAVDVTGAVDVVEQRERGKKDRYGTFEPAPGDERPLAVRSRKGARIAATVKWASQERQATEQDDSFNPGPATECAGVTVRPSATNTVSSARVASEVWKRSISRLYGA